MCGFLKRLRFTQEGVRQESITEGIIQQQCSCLHLVSKRSVNILIFIILPITAPVAIFTTLRSTAGNHRGKSEIALRECHAGSRYREIRPAQSA